MSRLPKLCYVMPEYDPDAHTHFSYQFSFLESLSRDLDIFLIIEKGVKSKENFGCKRVVVLRFKFLPIRLVELKLRILEARLRKYKNFYIHYSFGAAFMAGFITRIFGGRTFYWNCGLPWNYKRNFLREAFERLVYKVIHFLITGTESLKNDYAKHYSLPLAKIKVLPNWIDVKKFQAEMRRYDKEELRQKLNIDPKDKIILFVHRLSRRKGAHYLSDILKGLENEKAVLLVIGDGPEKENLKSQISNLKLEDKVRFLGWLSHDELASYYALADVFIMPSEEEGFPHVLLESMAAGIPFVAFDVGGVKEITPPERQSRIIEFGNVEKFVTSIKEILFQPEKENYSKWLEHYSLDIAVRLFKEKIISP